jgi:hypothetical protein
LSLFKVGDVVEWESQAAGISRTKEGAVVQVVKESHYPPAISGTPGSPRSHESYIVRASVMNGSEAQKRRTKLYWPKVKYLKLVRN